MAHADSVRLLEQYPRADRTELARLAAALPSDLQLAESLRISAAREALQSAARTTRAGLTDPDAALGRTPPAQGSAPPPAGGGALGKSHAFCPKHAGTGQEAPDPAFYNRLAR